MNSTAKTLICSVYEYFKKQSKKTKAGSAHNLIKKTKEATGFAERSIYLSCFKGEETSWTRKIRVTA